MDDTGPRVEPAIPAVFQSQSTAAITPPRLQLADWIASPSNPLTARVFVNRLWRLYFGTGLSRVLDDVGAQGEAPSHPELLDELAIEFVDSGWNIKHVIKLIVMSRTYRQSSMPKREMADIDPYNRLLARQSRFRLEAEMIRDNVLAVSGLMVRDFGGSSVKPYQPEGYWEHLYFPKRTYEHASDKNQYRRAVYMHWQRQFLHPALKIFDAPSREECTAERPRSNTPLGALALLNDPSHIEAARVLAEQVMSDTGKPVERQLQRLATLCLSRGFNSAEMKTLRTLLVRHKKHFEANPGAARELLATGLHQSSPYFDVAELAAWTSVVRAVLNMHETVTRN